MADRTFSWQEVVTAADGPDRHRDSLYPVVYTFGNNAQKRDTGPLKGPYEAHPWPGEH